MENKQRKLQQHLYTKHETSWQGLSDTGERGQERETERDERDRDREREIQRERREIEKEDKERVRINTQERD